MICKSNVTGSLMAPTLLLLPAIPSHSQIVGGGGGGLTWGRIFQVHSSPRPRCHPRGLVPRDVQPVARPGPVSAGGAAATPSTLAVPGYPRLPQVPAPARPSAPAARPRAARRHSSPGLGPARPSSCRTPVLRALPPDAPHGRLCPLLPLQNCQKFS